MNIEYQKNVGKTLRILRLRAGLSQEQVSVQLQILGCDMTRSAYAKIEVGQRHLYVDELKALKQVLNVPYEEILI